MNNSVILGKLSFSEVLFTASDNDELTNVRDQFQELLWKKVETQLSLDEFTKNLLLCVSTNIHTGKTDWVATLDIGLHDNWILEFLQIGRQYCVTCRAVSTPTNRTYIDYIVEEIP